MFMDKFIIPIDEFGKIDSTHKHYINGLHTVYFSCIFQTTFF